MSDVLERNLRGLLRRYRPVRPTPAFRRALHERLVVAVTTRPRRRWLPLSVAAAALVLVGLGIAWLRPPAVETGTLASIHASGRVAVRNAPDGEWRPLTEDPARFEADDAYLELALPPWRAANVVWEESEARLSEGARASLQLQPADDGGRVEMNLAAGKAALDGRWLVATSEASLATLGSVTLSYREPRLVARAFREPPDRSRPLIEAVARDAARVVLYLERDHLELDGAGTYHFQGGEILRPVVDAVSVDVEDRRPVEERAEEADPDPTSPVLRGRVALSSGTPVERFRVWLRTETEIPRVSMPVPHEFDGDAFELRPAPATYTVLVEVPGFAVGKRTGVALGAGATADLGTFSLEEGARVSGFVVDAETGAPVADALVLAEFDLPHQVVDIAGDFLADTPPIASARTDANGRYELAHLSFGRHHLRVGGRGYAPSWTSAFTLGRPAPDAPRTHRELPDVALSAGGRVEGRVERADGLPWAGAEVVLSMIVMDRPQPIFTFGGAEAGPDGSYAIELLPPGYYVALDLVGPGGTARSVAQTRVVEGETTRVDFLAPRQEARVHGTLTDADGTPLPQHSVSLAPGHENAGFENWVATETDAEGRFEFSAVKPGPYALFVDDRVDSLTRRAMVEIPAVADHLLDVALPRASIAGVLDLPPGADPHQVIVVLLQADGMDYEFFGRSVPASSGAFGFDGLEPGTYQVAGVGLDRTLGSVIGAPFEVIEDEERAVELALRPGGRLSLTVLDPEGSAVPDARVRIVDGRDRLLPFNVDPHTDLDGRLVLPSLGAGSWRLLVAREGFQTAQRTIEVEPGDELEIVQTLER